MRLASLLEARFQAALAPIGLTPRQFSILAVVQAHPDLNPAQVARMVMITPQSLGALIDQLERANLVVREGERKRGVKTQIRPSREGLRLLRNASRIVEELNKETRKHLGSAYPAVEEAVRDLFNHLEGGDAPGRGGD